MGDVCKQTDTVLMQILPLSKLANVNSRTFEGFDIHSQMIFCHLFRLSLQSLKIDRNIQNNIQIQIFLNYDLGNLIQDSQDQIIKSVRLCNSHFGIDMIQYPGIKSRYHYQINIWYRFLLPQPQPQHNLNTVVGLDTKMTVHSTSTHHPTTPHKLALRNIY